MAERKRTKADGDGARKQGSGAARSGRVESGPSEPAPSAAAKESRSARAAGGETGETHQRFASTSQSDPVKTRAFAIEAARMLADDKCEDVMLLDVTKLSQMSDYIVIGSGTSDRQMRSAADDVAKMGAGQGSAPYRVDADNRTTWIVVDFVDVVVHVFEPNTRAHYDLEMLWADAPRLEWERADQKNRNRAGLE